ncbi:MAG TPA: CARDB domain-containing protein [Candidatus Acidoferrum sp.]|nr:CARDB domain-containing protein [Candidatus Acidoferrum sp.]
MKNTSFLMWVFLLLFMCISAGFSEPSKADVFTTIRPSPQSVLTHPGLDFSVNIDVEMVYRMTGYQVYLSWDPSLLNATGIVQSGFVSSNSMYETFFTFQINNTLGLLQVWESQLAGNESSAAEGNGTLFTATFFAKNEGQCLLDVYNTGILLGVNSVDHVSEDGYVEIAGDHDVAVCSVVPFKTVVSQGSSINVNVTVENQGIGTETFSFTFYVNSTDVETVNVTDLASGARLITIFAWNTTEWVKGDYVLTVYAWPVQNETHIGDNTFTYNGIKITVPGDVNGDFKVGPADFALLSSAYGSTPASFKWNANCDMNNDGKVGPPDFAILSVRFGQHYP